MNQQVEQIAKVDRLVVGVIRMRMTLIVRMVQMRYHCMTDGNRKGQPHHDNGECSNANHVP